MAYKISFQKTAINEFDQIVAYLAQQSMNAASKFKDEWFDCLDALKEGTVDYGLSRFPKLASQGYHAVYFSNYVMLYFQSEDTRTIAHVFHQRQNYFNII